jgi:xanthine/uracil/vitamin C permease (AzgA family)
VPLLVIVLSDEPTQPEFRPIYQPHQLQAGAGATGGALSGMSAAKAVVESAASVAAVIKSLFTSTSWKHLHVTLKAP